MRQLVFGTSGSLEPQQRKLDPSGFDAGVIRSPLFVGSPEVGSNDHPELPIGRKRQPIRLGAAASPIRMLSMRQVRAHHHSLRVKSTIELTDDHDQPQPPNKQFYSVTHGDGRGSNGYHLRDLAPAFPGRLHPAR